MILVCNFTFLQPAQDKEVGTGGHSEIGKIEFSSNWNSGTRLLNVTGTKPHTSFVCRLLMQKLEQELYKRCPWGHLQDKLLTTSFILLLLPLQHSINPSPPVLPERFITNCSFCTPGNGCKPVHQWTLNVQGKKNSNQTILQTRIWNCVCARAWGYSL